MRVPKYVIPASIIGTLAGSMILLKDYMSGSRYHGEERMAGKTVIITGANTGIGKETSKELARRGAKVIMACRDQDKCEKARNEITLETANKNVMCRKLDLASFASIRAFARLVNETEPHVDVLVNNAGVMMCPKMLTEDGLEFQIGVNHFGHFLLTELLIKKLKSSAPSRIINVSSLAHMKGEIKFDDLNSANSYSKYAAYSQSKLANVLHTNELTRRLEGTGVTANSLHPGVVITELSRHLPLANSSISSFIFAPLKYVLMKTPAQGAQTTLRLAIDPALEKVSGKYYSDCQEVAANELAADQAIAKRLWAISEAWTKSNVK